ncbi:MAG: hypothetical protein JJ975_09885, partial [Bacteroidia bacterium]|nr:hypothetical protein [Bacteroidia bacterium]
TIHDCGVLLRTSGIRQKILALIWFKLPIYRSYAVTVVSEATKKHLLEIVNCPADKIRVINVPISEDFSFTNQQFNKEKPRILQLGAAPNKNLTRLINAVEGMSCHLVLIGKLSETNKGLLEAHNVSYENHIDLP